MRLSNLGLNKAVTADAAGNAVYGWIYEAASIGVPDIVHMGKSVVCYFPKGSILV